MRRLKETCVKKNPLYIGNSVNFFVDKVRLPNGKIAQREYLDHPGAVAVLPFVDHKNIVLVKQFRYPVHQVTYEIPAGKLHKGEAKLPCLKRELREETGYTAGRIRHLISYWPTAAFSDEILHIYAAHDLTPGPVAPDEDEFLEVVTVPFDRALKWILSGKIRDSKSVIAILAYRARRK